MYDHWQQSQAREEWRRVRRRALREAVVDVLTRRPGELVPLEEVRSRLNIRGSIYRGLMQVPLDKIIGSEGRYADFDRRFLPRGESNAQRWMKINQLKQSNETLPPVELYKIGDVYFVKDGNHRISVARDLGQQDIDAYVTEYEVDVPLDASFSMRDLILKEEYADFLDWTGLARLRPEQRIELSELGGYLDLINHINTHRYYLARERGAPVPAEEAVASWYDNVYQPVVESIRRHGILRHFPGRTEADLYLWIMNHRHNLHEQSGADPGPEAAVLDYASRFRSRSLLENVGEAIETMGHAVRNLAGWSSSSSTAQQDFQAWSHIDVLCPDIDVRLTDPAGYQRLRAYIEAHQREMSENWQRRVELDEAVRDWCEHFFKPTVEAIRERNLLADWPGHTEADLYLEAMDLRHQATDGELHPDPQAAVAALEPHSHADDAGHTHADDSEGLLESARRLLRRRRP